MLFRHLRLALLWALLILALCLMPGQDLPQWRWADLLSLDKWVHAGMFAVLVVLLVLGLKRQYGPAWARSKGLWTAAIVCILYGVALELMQGLLMQGRTATRSNSPEVCPTQRNGMPDCGVEESAYNIKKVFSLGSKDDEAKPGVEPSRDYLTEPPTGYRAPKNVVKATQSGPVRRYEAPSAGDYARGINPNKGADD